MDTYTLSNGMVIPCLGYGTTGANGDANYEIIARAIDNGYHYIDTASLYETERAVGDAVKKSGLKRSDFFIVSKVWWDELGYKETKEALKRTLDRLQMDYIDLYLMHWPRRSTMDPDWKQVDLDSWRAMEEAVDAGLVRGIGCSNFLPHHLDNILANCRIRPVVNQLEIHPGYSQEAAVAHCFRNDVRPQAWSPLGRSKVLNHPYLISLGEKYGKSSAQICVRFCIQKGIIPIVRSTGEERMKQNLEVFDFALTEEEVQILSCMPQDMWLGEHPDFAVPTKRCSRDQ